MNSESIKQGGGKCTLQNQRVANIGKDHSGSLIHPPFSSRIVLDHIAQDYVHLVLEYLL